MGATDKSFATRCPSFVENALGPKPLVRPVPLQPRSVHGGVQPLPFRFDKALLRLGSTVLRAVGIGQAFGFAAFPGLARLAQVDDLAQASGPQHVGIEP